MVGDVNVELLLWWYSNPHYFGELKTRVVR